MIKLSGSVKLNEIHMVDSPFNEDPKNIFFQGGPNFEGGTAGKFREMGNNRNIYCYANRGGGEFRKRISAPTPWYQNPRDASIFLHARSNFKEKVKKLNFQAKI